MSLKIEESKHGQDIHLKFKGILDETAMLPALPHNIEGKVVIDLGLLTMINSLGCRTWLRWITSFHARDGVSLVHCSRAFIAQVNVLAGFIPEGVSITSFHVPYHCHQCFHEEEILFTVGKDLKHAQSCRCANCGGESELAVFESKYFNFLPKKSA